jgi:hypothetical protein
MLRQRASSGNEGVSVHHRGLATNAEKKNGPVMACVIEVGKGIIAYSNSQGEWPVRVKEATPLPLAVLPAVFVAPGEWIVKNAPSEAVPGTPVDIEVARQTIVLELLVRALI